MTFCFQSFCRGAGAVAVLATLSALTPSKASAQAEGDIRVEVTNEGGTDFFLTPLWFGFHNGGFNLFDSGGTATPGLEQLAEIGSDSILRTEFAASPGTPGDIQGSVAGTSVGPPPIDPGETGVGFVTPINPANYQFFSFASMIIPTNDAFIGNDNPLEYQVFNSLGEINSANGIFEIAVFESFDAGTEVNDPSATGGAAFSAIAVGTEGVTENGTISLVTDLSQFGNNLQTASGAFINDTDFGGGRIATIRISRVAAIPEPSSVALLSLAGFGLGLRRRRSN